MDKLLVQPELAEPPARAPVDERRTYLTATNHRSFKDEHHHRLSDKSPPLITVERGEGGETQNYLTERWW